MEWISVIQGSQSRIAHLVISYLPLSNGHIPSGKLNYDYNVDIINVEYGQLRMNTTFIR